MIANGNAPSENFNLTLVDVRNPGSPVLLARAEDGLNGADYLWQPAGLSFAGTTVVVGGFGSPFAYDFGLTILGIGSQAVGLDSAGWVGIGTTQPKAALDVVGNVLVENATLFDVSAHQVALGDYAGASGWGSSAIGSFATASGNGATALGNNTTASGTWSTAMGSLTTASGNYSTAMGNQATAAHDNTFV
ncbi:MAG: hypothetical protein NT154_19885 [Verrucomicrobia bacterium]|nr:hypothetical protein [Verrucomicrobiota bacterium]